MINIRSHHFCLFSAKSRIQISAFSDVMKAKNLCLSGITVNKNEAAPLFSCLSIAVTFYRVSMKNGDVVATMFGLNSNNVQLRVELHYNGLLSERSDFHFVVIFGVAIKLQQELSQLLLQGYDVL